MKFYVATITVVMGLSLVAYTHPVASQYKASSVRHEKDKKEVIVFYSPLTMNEGALD